MTIQRKSDQTWIAVKGVDDVFRIALCFSNRVCVIANKQDMLRFPAGTKELTSPDLDGDLLVEVEASSIDAFLTDREVDDECEDEEAAAA